MDFETHWMLTLSGAVLLLLCGSVISLLQRHRGRKRPY